MNKTLAIVVGVLVIGLGAYWLFSQVPAEAPNETPDPDTNGEPVVYNDLLRIDTPQPDQEITSPLTIRGEARGQWYFEASFPIRLLDANGNDIAIEPSYIMTDEEWMTEEFVPFETTITFTTPGTETGTLVFERANPSGLPENDDEFRMPIRFTEDDDAPERTVSLYYYDPSQDEDENGNIMCSREGLVAVERSIPVTQTPIQDTVRLLLEGELTAAEESAGITTEYPLEGLRLEGAAMDNGTLTLAFDDPSNTTSGGSCRASILWYQIEATALQFDEVDKVEFEPETLFQP